MSAQPQPLPFSQSRIHDILCAHGRSALDYFKAAPDKSIFFSSSGDSFLAYRVAGSFAMVLGDPVGPDREIPEIMEEFAAACARRGRRFALYQTLPEFLPLYRQLGFTSLKLGDDAVVDLKTFSLKGGRGRSLRSSIHKAERLGVHGQWLAPPLSSPLLDELQAVADAWRRIPGRRERHFALGQFDRVYLRDTPVFVARSAADRALAFVNIVPSYRAGEATIDLIRRRSAATNGVMDYLLIELFERSRKQGFERFNLGMAPMSGFRTGEKASREERLVHFVFQHLDFVFSYRGLRAFKAKFASTWEPRYVVYRRAFDLPRLVFALADVSER